MGRLEDPATQKRIKRLQRARNYNRNVEALVDEIRVEEWLLSLGWDVTKSETWDDILLDIDLWVDGVPISVKAEHEGMRSTQNGRRYYNIYFELATQHYTGHQWEDPTELEWVRVS